MTASVISIRLQGNVLDLFSHMILWGLAEICADAGLTGARGHWTDDPSPVPVLTVQAEIPEEVARAVHAHATRRAAEGSWLRSVAHPDPSKAGTVATFAPRSAMPVSAGAWQALDQRMEGERRSLPSPLDGRLLQGLGYRSWWVIRDKKMRTDLGCSPWEMRTRNKGTDVVADRLLPLAAAVSTWSEEKILQGLTGAAMDDVVGKNAADSRSATGFRLPGPVDSARAWCALWGLSFLPVLPSLGAGATAPAFVHKSALEDTDQSQLLIVVPAKPMPIARFAQLQRSASLIATVKAPSSDPGARLSALTWLRARGASTVLRFPVRVVGSTSAPERQALSGVEVTG